MNGTILFLVLVTVVTGASFGGLISGWRGAVAGAGVLLAVAMSGAASLFF